VRTALDCAVELLDRSLGYTRVVLADVGPDDLDRPTPCTGWDLKRLLAHMEDALDAFTEAAAGQVDVGPAPETSTRVDALREKACALLGAWASVPRTTVEVGGVGLDAPVLVATAALEITLHGWDVAQATGRRARIPDDLARGLLSVARTVIFAEDRGPRFATPRPVSAAADPAARLLGWSGRFAPGQMTGPAPGNRPEPRTRRGMAS
jgi:uncharacterized protein (TIGR03086 family)